MLRVFAYLLGAILLTVLVLVFLPMLVLGHALRGLGSIICNLAFRLQDGLEWVGNNAINSLLP